MHIIWLYYIKQNCGPVCGFRKRSRTNEVISPKFAKLLLSPQKNTGYFTTLKESWWNLSHSSSLTAVIWEEVGMDMETAELPSSAVYQPKILVIGRTLISQKYHVVIRFFHSTSMPMGMGGWFLFFWRRTAHKRFFEECMKNFIRIVIKGESFIRPFIFGHTTSLSWREKKCVKFFSLVQLAETICIQLPLLYYWYYLCCKVGANLLWSHSVHVECLWELSSLSQGNLNCDRRHHWFLHHNPMDNLLLFRNM